MLVLALATSEWALKKIPFIHPVTKEKKICVRSNGILNRVQSLSVQMKQASVDKGWRLWHKPRIRSR